MGVMNQGMNRGMAGADLCPLDTRKSLTHGFSFKTAFSFTDNNRNRKKAHVDVSSVHGLSASDELYLWGLLGLALSQPEPSPDFHATPYWCLKQLGIVNGSKKGSEEFRLFRESLKRLAGIRYHCDRFFDPVRREHREVSFGFLSYSLPLSSDVARTWRFAWDPILWELCSATAGALRFDIGTYRDLSPASRRFYLLLKKLFWRSDHSPHFEIRELAVNTLGFSPDLPTKEIKRKLLGCLQELMRHEIIQLGIGQSTVADCIVKKSKGVFTLQVCRGPGFNTVTATGQPKLEDLPIYDPLAALGFDRASIARIANQHSPKLIQLWADITLAASEQGRIDNSPQAFFTYYIQRATAGICTPPDWWRDIERHRRSEERAQERERSGIRFVEEDELAFRQYLETEAREAFASVMQRLHDDLRSVGKSQGEAEAFAHEQATLHFRNRFRQRRKAGSDWSRLLPVLHSIPTPE